MQGCTTGDEHREFGWINETNSLSDQDEKRAYLRHFCNDLWQTLEKLGLLKVVALHQGVEVLQCHRSDILEERNLCAQRNGK